MLETYNILEHGPNSGLFGCFVGQFEFFCFLQDIHIRLVD